MANPMSSGEKEKALALKRSIEDQIDTFLKKVGYENPAEITDENGIRAFCKESASGVASVCEFEGSYLLIIQAQVMLMPSDKELLLPLFRELLEINTDILGPVRIGIQGENIIASIANPIEDVREGDVERHIASIMDYADELDDKLKAKYGGTSKKRGS